jgi:hypothetical protein
MMGKFGSRFLTYQQFIHLENVVEYLHMFNLFDAEDVWMVEQGDDLDFS